MTERRQTSFPSIDGRNKKACHAWRFELTRFREVELLLEHKRYETKDSDEAAENGANNVEVGKISFWHVYLTKFESG